MPPDPTSLNSPRVKKSNPARALEPTFLNTRAEVNRDFQYGVPTTVGVACRATHTGPYLAGAEKVRKS